MGGKQQGRTHSSSLSSRLRAPEPGGRSQDGSAKAYLCGRDRRAEKGDVSHFIQLQMLSSDTHLRSEHHLAHTGLGYKKETVLDVR